MKLKLNLVVASMSVLGMISCPTFAAASQHTTKHHQKAPAQKVSLKGEEMAIPAPVVNDWYNRISIDGGVNFDAKWGARNQGFEGENNQRLSLNDVHLNVTAPIADWAKAFASLSYDNASQLLAGASTAANPLATVNSPKPGKYDNIKDSIGGVNIEQAYVKFANMSEMPIYATLGKQFVDFGKYNLHPLTQPLTQVLSETLRNAATIGFDTKVSVVDVFGSAYVFDNPYKQQISALQLTVNPSATGSSQAHTKANYGARLGLGQTADPLTWDLSFDYLYNFTGVEGVAYGVGLFNGTNAGGNVGNNGTSTGGTFASRVGAGAINADLKTGPFDVELRYVTALQHFNVYDLSSKTVPTATLATATSGAHPWAAGINAGYAFNAWSKDQNVFLGYQATNNAVNLYLPRNRIALGYGVDVLKTQNAVTNVGFELDHDNDYSLGNGGTGDNNNQLGLRVGVKFG